MNATCKTILSGKAEKLLATSLTLSSLFLRLWLVVTHVTHATNTEMKYGTYESVPAQCSSTMMHQPKYNATTTLLKMGLRCFSRQDVSLTIFPDFSRTTFKSTDTSGLPDLVKSVQNM